MNKRVFLLTFTFGILTALCLLGAVLYGAHISRLGISSHDIATYNVLHEEVPNTLDERFNFRKRSAEVLDLGLASNSTSNIEELLQYPELPYGCESVSATIVLRSFGFDISKTQLWDNYLEFEKTYDSFDATKFTHLYALPPAIVLEINKYLSDENSDLLAFDITGTPFEALYDYIEAGYSILVWTTSYMEAPHNVRAKEGYCLYYPEHCVVLYGYDSNQDIAYVADPQEGLVERSLDKFKAIYDEVGRMAVIVM